MTTTVDIETIHPPLSELLSLLSKNSEVILMEGDKPVAQLTSITGSRIPGLHPNSIEVSDDFDEPLSDEFWLGKP